MDEKGKVIAYCAEIHDVAISKLIAGREKDFRFLNDAFRLEIVSVEEFIARISLVKSMPQSAVLTDRMQKLERHLTDQKTESMIISPIREFLRELRKS